MKKLLLAAAILLFCVPMANANVIPFGGFSGSEFVEDFESLGSAPATGPFTLGNLTFSEQSTGSGGPGWGLPSNLWVPGSQILTDNAGKSNFMVDFPFPGALRVGLDFGIGPATYQVSFFNPSLSLLGSVSGNTGNIADNFFAFWEDIGGISRIQIFETSDDNGLVGGLDNVRYELTSTEPIPEPATMLLLGTGLVGVAGASRRRKKKQA